MNRNNPLRRLSCITRRRPISAFSIPAIAVWIAALLFSGTLGAPVRAETPEVLRIGGLLHLTGEFSIQGQAFREGMELGAEAVRESAGPEIRLVFEDTQYAALRALTGAKKLVASDHVDAAVISTAVEAKAAGPEFQRAKTPAVVLWDSSPEIEQIGNYIFSIGPWIPSSGERMAQYARDWIHARTAAIIHTNTEWSAAVAEAFRNDFQRRGGTIVSFANENPSETDFRTTLIKAKRLTPDVFYVPVDANLIAFFNQARQLNIDVPLLTSDIITEDNLQENPAAFDGVTQSMPNIRGTEASKDLLERYQKKFQRPCTQVLFAAWGYDAVRLIADAYQRAKGQGNDGLRQALLATKNFPGASNTITMNEHGSAPTPLSIFRVTHGHFLLLPQK